MKTKQWPSKVVVPLDSRTGRLLDQAARDIPASRPCVIQRALRFYLRLRHQRNALPPEVTCGDW